jgi:ribosomal protein L16 Arg81 hydroxylase
MIQDYTTFDNQEKIAKLSNEYDNYSRLLQKESSSEWNMKKRKQEDIDEKNESAVNSKKANSSH